ncbi:MAG: sulfate adenylyltransferase [Acidimicrobiia bacterium]|nr:sulfate adenylyltransferase [Acidimicrobiia bacterium]NNC41617.1 sulfate adenylyltransferase [Acidimicrobiia bacterium]NNL48214.1 sulfate adenylyltransferase [Acidimicrobiia bacterium]
MQQTVATTAAPSELKILCTLGPASMDPRTIQRLEQSGATLFRINLSHTEPADLPRLIKIIRSATDVPICLDTEGAQIRTGRFVDGQITLRDHALVKVHKKRVPADDKNFNFYPPESVEMLVPGDFVRLDFNSALAQVVSCDDEAVVMRVLQGGPVGQNKAVVIERDLSLPPLTAKDVKALAIGRDLGITHFALSFANKGEDVLEIRTHVGNDAFVISKIESRGGVQNLEEIASHSDALLIDRGDLSRQVPIELLPQAQKSLIKRGNAANTPVYVATNLLESMVSSSTPTRAEVNDIHNTLADGADGLVLAAETAIGQYPIRCASMISKVIRGYQQDGLTAKGFYPEDAISLLVEPHGGRLVHREASDSDRSTIEHLTHVAIREKDLMDCEQFAYGTYSPLTGFMGRETLESVLDTYRLPNGEVWTLPLLLQIDADKVRNVSAGDRIVLTDESGRVHSLLDVTEMYRYDLDSLAARMYGTTNRDHPGVAQLTGRSDLFVAGHVTLVEPLASPHRHYLLSPVQTRFIFTQLGWSQVVGFHTRNPTHRGHEWIQLQALERTGADGLYINPIGRPEKPGDFLPEAIMLSYQTLLEFGYYPKGRVVLGSFFTYSRYAGPREAVFTALCRKNMGCSHFIVGRDHTGVGDFYPKDASRWIFETVGDMGIEPVFFETVGHNPATGEYEVDRGQHLDRISGTRVRESLRSGSYLPDWFMRDLAQEVLMGELQSGRQLFYE